MENFELTKLVANLFFPNNLVQADDTGLPSILVYIPAFKNSDVLTGGDDSVHPAFIVNGKTIPGFYYSKYQNIVHTGVAYSLPGEDPQTTITLDKALEVCEAKGYGWHLSTAAEWAAIALWCKKNGFLPYGNNNYGKDSRESEYKAVPTYRDADGAIARVATGTGPVSWSHDRTMSGIWDMNGNIWEWQGGIRLVWGELQILADNDAADPDNPQNDTSTCWKAINAADGSLVEPESNINDTAVKTSGGTVKLDYLNGAWTYSTSVTNASTNGRYCQFIKVTCDNTIGDAAKVLLRTLALLPDEGVTNIDYESDIVYWINSASEVNVFRGGCFNNGAAAGIFYIAGLYPRTFASSYVGFRCAYIPEITQ